MIDEQNPIQIAAIPLGLKCHTPIQQLQQLQQQQQQQQQQQSTNMLMNGSQRMLTTLTTTMKTTSSGATINDNGAANSNVTTTTKPIKATAATTKANTTTASSASASMLDETSVATMGVGGGGGGGVGGAGSLTIATATASITDSLSAGDILCGSIACGEINGNPTTPTATTATTFYKNVIGTCNSNKNNSNNAIATVTVNNDYKCYNNSNNNNNNNHTKVNNIGVGQRQQEMAQQQQQQQMNVTQVTGVGPGRPPPDGSPTHFLSSLYCNDRTTTTTTTTTMGGEFNFNVSGCDGGDGVGGNDANCNDACAMAAIYTANANKSNNNNNNNINNNNNNCIDHNGNSNLTNCLNGNNDNNGNNTNNTNNNNKHMFLTIENCKALEQKQQQQQQQQQQQHQHLQHQQHQHHLLQMHFGTQMQTQFPNDDCSPCHTPPIQTTSTTAPTAAATNATTKSDSISANNNNNNNNNNATALGLPMALPLPLPLSLSLHLPLPSALTCHTTAASMLMPDAMQCAYCCQPICDRYIMRVLDTSFHEGCLKCATCALHLVHSCYARDGKLYCRIDYERQFLRNRCLGCGHRIGSDELVMRTFDNVFHLKCFACVVCGGLLKKGEQYVVKQGQLFCRLDYEKEVEMLQGYDFYGDDLFAPKMDGRRGPKRPRTILNTQQRRAFKASFELSPKPCRKVRENLAKETGLSLRIVQVWFQNQRAKVKKIQKKAKQEHSKGASDSQDSQESDNSNLAKIKDEAHSDSESLLESPYSACAGSVGDGGGSASSLADGFVKMRSIKDENENTTFNCMETNKENCNKTNEPFLNTVLGLSYSTFQQLIAPLTQSPMVNPIDRLYSMQNSYFRPEELSYNGCSKDLVQP